MDLKRLDVRPILLAGGEPFEEIMAFQNGLQPWEPFELVATFRPDPLISLLGGRGYEAAAEEREDGDWLITFRPRAQ
jgi:hypothetical protein